MLGFVVGAVVIGAVLLLGALIASRPGDTPTTGRVNSESRRPAAPR